MSFNQYGPTTTASTSLASLVASIGSAKSTIWVVNEQRPGNLTIPVNIQLIFLPGGKITPTSGALVDIIAEPFAGAFQIFDYSAGGRVDFGGQRFNQVRLEWFGLISDGTTSTLSCWNNALAASNAAMNLTVSGIPQLGLPSPIVVDSKTSLKVIAENGPGLFLDFAGPQFHWTGNNTSIMVDFFQCTGCVMDGFIFFLNGALTGAAFEGKTTSITSANTLRNCQIIMNTGATTAASCVTLGDNTTGQNAEFHQFERTWFVGPGGAAGSRVGIGYFQNYPNDNDHGHVFRDCRFFNLSNGTSGGFGCRLEGQNASGTNDISYNVQSINYPIQLGFCGDESSLQMAAFTAVNNASFEVFYSRIATTPTALLASLEFGASVVNAVTVRGNKFFNQTPGTKYDCTVATQMSILLIGNVYSGGNNFLNGIAPRTITSINDGGASFSFQSFSTNGVAGSVLGDWSRTGQGDDLTIAGGAIDVEKAYHRVGAGLLTTINTPGVMGTDIVRTETAITITLECGATPFTFSTAGNIAAAGTPSTPRAYQAVDFTYNPSISKWCPHWT